MSYKIIPVPRFLKDIKILKKKYLHIVQDVDGVVESLRNNPEQGIQVYDNIYKIRVKSSDLKKGKSGGFRVIYYLVNEKLEIYLITIYSKSEKENISTKEIESFLKGIF